VQPTLLLFLQRLSCLAVTDVRDPSRCSIMVRQPLGGPLVELRHGPQAEQRSTWLLVSHKIKPTISRWGGRAGIVVAC
jgi:hypothetical protein